MDFLGNIRFVLYYYILLICKFEKKIRCRIIKYIFIILCLENKIILRKGLLVFE